MILDSLGEGDRIALASSPSIISAWTTESDDPRVEDYSIDSYLPLRFFNWSRPSYTKSLHGNGEDCPYLSDRLLEIRDAFHPDIAITTSQNAYFDRAFQDMPRFYLEQAPLPRLGQPFRTIFDPCGHQNGSILEKHAQPIRDISLDTQSETAIENLIERMRRSLLSHGGSDLIEELQRDAKVAIFATQPPNWISYEGAYRDIDLEGLLCEWEQHLPPGWIGVPTFHGGYRLPEAAEEHLSASNRRLRFLPPSHAQGLSEALIAAADALVSISSTTSTTAIMLGKPVVTVGQCPYNAWTGRDISQLDSLMPVGRPDVLRLVAFLCHNLTLAQDQVERDPSLLRQLLENRLDGDEGVAFCFDFSTWSPDSLESYFRFPVA